MGLALFGVALVAETVLLRRWLASRLAAQGRDRSKAWEGVWHAPLLWLGVILIVQLISEPAAFAIGTVWFVGYLVFFVVLVVRGVRAFPEFWRRARRIGDPEAWRGN